MPGYWIRVETNVTLDTSGLERLEDVVYDTLVDEFGASTETYDEGIGVTDVDASFN